ncbi:hypothetical protein DL240_13195 [Lujinxingia litoralis]|uniref:Uncharacterized protein n=1 Tax=Lujinxingia litoralis TaxID=2211119 RepID=A0A328C483_9DELT|nr:hypothetical protein [Lujinxingia litoralis]RAL21802.1 hypothetical protein DL240_13195 [Lujinxingia litoralis]
MSPVVPRAPTRQTAFPLPICFALGLLSPLPSACGEGGAPYDQLNSEWEFEEPGLSETPDTPDVDTDAPPELPENEGRYLAPLPEGFEVERFDDAIVFHLEWEHLTDERPLVSKSVDLDLVYCRTPPATTFTRLEPEHCVAWSTPEVTWEEGGNSVLIRTGPDATRDGIPEQIGHPSLQQHDTHVGVLYASGGYEARATLSVYVDGELYQQKEQILSERGQTWYALIASWNAITISPALRAAPPCAALPDAECANTQLYLGPVPLADD